MGAHNGDARRVARGLRAACRPVPVRWADDVAGLGEVRRRVLAWLDEGVGAPEGLDAVAWVPGHDGTPGPAHLLACLVGEVWSLPVAELVTRRVAVPSAWASSRRPSTATQLGSLSAIPSRRRRLVLVDNTIATGASITAAAAALHAAGHDVAGLVTVTSTRFFVA